MSTIQEFAPAKLNLYLHITGRRADGYHDLDSLVAFAAVGDVLALEPAGTFDFTLEGPQADVLRTETAAQNLAVKAVHSLARLTSKPLDFKLTLIKNLPVASGIGGGSSDAAAALRAAARHWQIALDSPDLITAAAEHGQDVPVCLKIINNYITATGTEPAENLPSVHLVMVNPNRGLPTPSVYKRFRENNGAFSPRARLGHSPKDIDELVTELKKRNNDLFVPAVQLMPDIGLILRAMESTADCLLARMSGSGATCFALYSHREAAVQAAEQLQTHHPEWWVAATHLPFKANHD